MKTFKDLIELGINSKITQKAFIIVKPGFLKYTKQIIEKFEECGWQLNKIKTKQLLLQEAHKLYETHKKEKFYKNLCEYMTSGQTTAILFTNKKQISSDVFKEVNNIKDEIRNQYGESEMRNVIHSSDSLDRLRIESGIYF